MSEESIDLLKIARENYGWAGFLLTFLVVMFKEPRAAFMRWWRKPSWKQMMAEAWTTLAREVAMMRGSLESINKSFHDVSRQAEISAEISRLALNDSETPRWETDHTGSCIWVNTALAKLFGMAPAEMLGFGWTRAIEPGHAEVATSAFHRAYSDSSYIYSCQYAIVKDDQLVNIVAKQVGEIRDTNGKIVRMFGTCRKVETMRSAVA